MAKFNIDQKINQNTICLIVGALLIGASERLGFGYVVWCVGVSIVVVSAVSVCLSLIPYTINYWKEKMKDKKD